MTPENGVIPNKGSALDNDFWSLVPSKVSPEMNSDLLSAGTEDEILSAIKSMGPFKAPGPDGRLLHDNAMLAYELLYAMKTKPRLGHLAFKLDMSKAFDRVEWSFLKRLFLHLGFAEQWVQIIMEFLSTVSYSLVINGESDAERNHHIQGVSIGRGYDPINHLFFADDALLFCKANISQALHLKTIISKYGSLIGQVVNFDKSSLFFSSHISIELRDQLRRALDILNVDWINRYLGLPSVLGRSKKSTFSYLVNQTSFRIKTLKGEFLSKAGRENGGLGFRDLEAFNIALLAKVAWKFKVGNDSMLFRIFKQRYFRNCSFLGSSCSPGHSWVWRIVSATKEIILKGLKWRIGDGKSINCWNAPWLSGNSSFKVTSAFVGGNVHTVADLINHQSRSWKTSVVLNSFNPKDSARILQISLSSLNRPDSKIWGLTPNGQFTVKSACNAALSIINPTPSHQGIGCSYETDLKLIWKNDSLLDFHVPISHPLSSHWIPPPQSSIKLNFDASFDASTNRAGGGFILRNHEVYLLRSFGLVFQNVPSAIVAEAHSFRVAVQTCIDLGLPNVLIEGDCQPIMHLQFIDEAISNIILDVQHLVQIGADLSLHWTPISGNQEAHEVCRFALNFVLSSSVTDLGPFLPSSVRDALFRECSFVS
ncbi:uncharacterized protein LOC132269745 [Cornus florida]|uniref:uncharacterized protein LOC132269745 n=1 Tax=Cornus florida TaxID=4283 RepID=UPI0028A273C1|nr:uncharacterized protein LOC132269745 [Cornus florida]